jgi:hypothetical protein
MTSICEYCCNIFPVHHSQTIQLESVQPKRLAASSSHEKLHATCVLLEEPPAHTHTHNMKAAGSYVTLVNTHSTAQNATTRETSI